MHGNVVQLLDESGNVTKTYEYDSFGNEVKPEKKDENPYRYCGEYYDKETEEVYLRARYYEPSVGRFITRDTYTGESDEPLSLHLYTYCENDGVNMVDPSGHWGRKDGKYVHQDITKEALMNLNYVKVLNHSQYKLLLDGSIYPDFLNAKSNNIKKFGAQLLNEKTSKFYKKYKNRKKQIKEIKRKYKINLENNDMLHGKNKNKLEKAKMLLCKKLPKNIFRMNKNMFFVIGCVLHSIQDYSAHSYISDLNSFKNRKHSIVSNIELTYHSDWTITNKAARDKEHKKYKDNPYMDYVVNSVYGEWKKCSKRNQNSRYRKAIYETEKFLKKTIFNKVS